MKSLIRIVVITVVLGTAAGALYHWRGAVTALAGNVMGKEAEVPTIAVRKGDLTITMKANGDVKALKNVTLYAPFSVTDVKLVSVSKTGTMVKAGDVVAVIDATQEKDKVKEQESNVIQADKETDKVKATHRAVEEQARLDKAQAGYDVQGAKLETRKQEILSAIDAGKAQLALETSQRHLTELENSEPPRKDSQGADLNVVARRRKKAEQDMNFAKHNIDLLTIKAPTGGMLVILQNWRSRMGFGNAPEFKPGDQAWPGAALAEIPDLKTLVVELTVEETERGKIALGQSARIKLDAIPDRDFTGSILKISTTALLVLDGWPPKKNFKATVNIAQEDPRLRPNMSAHTELDIEKLTAVTLIPTRATFDRGGHTIVWIKRGKRYEAREVLLGKKSDGQAQVLSGVEVGDVIALEQPAKGTS